MACVITDACFGEKNAACVEVCPVDCIYDAVAAGFPTYIKYKDPHPHLIVNATETEPLLPESRASAVCGSRRGAA